MRMTSKGQVTIPIEMREKLGLFPNVEVEFHIDRDSVRIRKARGKKTRGRLIVERLRGSAPPGGVATEDPEWVDWSASMLETAGERGALLINPLIFAEVSVRFETIEAVEAAIP